MSRRPNVLFLMTDHTSARAIAPGSQCLKPNLDALASEGVRFGRCYTTNAICSPARASLMTSTYPSTHGMWDCTHTQRKEWVNVEPDLTYWSQRLKAEGYRTGYFGKWHVEQTLRLEDFGWSEYDHQCGSARQEVVDGSEVIIPREGYRDYLMAGVGKSGDGPTRHPAFEKGIDFVRRSASSDEPFCCFVSAAEPHDPYIPPAEFWEMYDVGNVRVSDTLRDEPVGKPELLRRMRAVWTDLTDENWQRISAAYWGVISFIDSEIGRILDVLRETKQYENTIIVFTSDHGDMLGGHGLATKGIGTGYEEVYNIPLVMRVPGVTRESEEARCVASLVDLGPTILDYCSARAIEGAHGRTLRPILEGAYDPENYSDAYAEFFGQRFVYTQRLVWHGPWKFIFSPGGIDELYNLVEDPCERTNLAEDPTCRDVLIDMTKRMWRKMETIGDDSLFNTHYATLRTAPVGPLARND
jgi:arylsulfatase A-like enzyme